MSFDSVTLLACEYWDQVVNQLGFNLSDFIRRRKLVPFVLTSRHVASRHKNIEKDFFYHQLRQAHDAFIFGIPFSCFALLRSIMESVLKRHYRAIGSDLSEQINSIQSQLPRGVNVSELHRLRRLANDILHGNEAGVERIRELKSFQLEKEIVGFLIMTRSLIEGAPPLQKGH